MSVLPEPTPVTMPNASTEATEALPVVQVPPAVVGLKTTVLPTQTVDGPEIVPAEVIGATVTSKVVNALEQAVVTV